MEEEHFEQNMLDASQKDNSTIHLLRVRIHKKNFEKLKHIAKTESKKFGEYISVSDLVRSQIINLLQVYKTKERLEVVVNPKIKPNLRKG